MMSIVCIKLGLLIVGSIIGARIFRKIGVAQFLSPLIFAFIFWIVKDLAILWILIGVFTLLTHPKVKLSTKFWRSLKESDLLSFFDQALFSMQAGKSFRNAIEGAIEGCEENTKMIFREIWHSHLRGDSEFTGSGGKIAVWLFKEIQKIEKKGQRHIDQIRSLRNSIYLIVDFQKKSAKALIQARMQAIVAGFLYVFVGIFSGMQFGFENRVHDYLISGAGFIVGLLWILKMGRRIEWKT